MAKTYYKYDRRNATPVDYAGASKDLADGLMDVVTGLEENADEFSGRVKKAQDKVESDIEKEAAATGSGAASSSKKDGAKTSDTGGEYGVETSTREQNVNTVALGLSDEASKLKLDLKRKYQSQQISDREFNVLNENLGKSFDDLKLAVAGVNKMAEETAVGIEEGTASPAQQTIFKEILRYNYKDPKVKFEFNKNNNLVVYRVDDSGNKVSGSERSITQLQEMSLQRIKAFDIVSESAQMADAIGKTTEQARKAGMTMEDILNNEPTMTVGNVKMTPVTFIDDYVENLDDFKLADILMSQMGGKYKPSTTLVSGDEDNTILYMEADPSTGMSGQRVPSLTKEQKSEAQRVAKESILVQLNPKQAKEYAPSKPSSASIARGERIDNAVANVERLEKIFTGNAQQRKEGLASFSKELSEVYGDGKNQFVSAEIIGDELVITRINEFNQTEPHPFPIPDTFEEFVHTVGPTLLGNEDIVTYYDEATKGKDYTGLKRSSDEAAYKIEVEEPPMELAPRRDYMSDVATLVDKVDIGEGAFNVTFDETTNKQYEAAITDLLTASGMTGYDVSRSGNTITVNVDGLGSASVSVNQEVDGRSRVKKFMADIYDKVSKGEKIGEVAPAGSKLLYPEWKKQNPKGTQKEYLSYFNS